MENRCYLCGKETKHFDKFINKYICKDCILNEEMQESNNPVDAISDLMFEMATEKTKRIIKRASKLEANTSLEEILNANTKRDITLIADSLMIKYKKTDPKKVILSNVLEQFKDSLMKLILAMDNERYKLIKSFTENNSITTIDEIGIDNDVDYFQDRGILFPAYLDDDILFVTPKEVSEVLLELNNKDIKQRLKDNEELIKLYKGTTFYYGIVSLDTFIDNISNEVDITITEGELNLILKEGSEYYINYDYDFNEEIGYSLMLDGKDELFAVLESTVENYKAIGKKKLLEASKEDFIGEDSIYKSFNKSLKKYYGLNNDDLEAVATMIYITAQTQELEEVVEELLDQISPPNKDIALEIELGIREAYRKVPQWRLKGSSLAEIENSARDRWNEVKIGRNDPCNCGSGKKYKKCCGSKVIQLF